MTKPLDAETARRLWVPLQDALDKLDDRETYPLGSDARREQEVAYEEAKAALAPYFTGELA